MNRIKELRIAKGHESQREFAHFISTVLGYKVSNSTIHLLEANKNNNPYWRLVAVLADYFNVSADYLMGREEVSAEVLSPTERTALKTFIAKLKTA